MTREQLLAKLEEYQTAMQQHLAEANKHQDLANANQGAAEAIQWVLAEMDKQEAGTAAPEAIKP